MNKELFKEEEEGTAQFLKITKFHSRYSIEPILGGFVW